MVDMPGGHCMGRAKRIARAKLALNSNHETPKKTKGASAERRSCALPAGFARFLNVTRHAARNTRNAEQAVDGLHLAERKPGELQP